MADYPRRRKRTRTWKPEVLRAFSELVGGVEQPSIREVRKSLVRQFGDADVPSERTLFDMRDEMRDESGRWRLEEATPSEAWPVLDALLALSDRHGRPVGLTKLEARLIANIRAANPSMSGERAYAEARWYIAHRHRDDWALGETLIIANEAREARKTPKERRDDWELARVNRAMEEDESG